MAKDGSVAPKERINIVYKAATGDAQSEIELPLKLMVLGDFTMLEDTRQIEDRTPVSINKDNFNDVMKGQDINLNFNVQNKLTSDSELQIPVQLKIEKMRDFEPDAIVSQVPELAKLLQLRNALKALKGPLSNIPEFRKKIQEVVSNEQARKILLDELGLSESNEN